MQYTLDTPPYTTIPLHPLCPLHTVSTGLTFLHQRQCLHHHMPLFHCVLHPLCTASREYCIHCIHWYDLFAPKTMSPPPYTTIPLHALNTASTASTGLTFLHQRQCSHYSTAYCVLCPQSTASTVLTFLHQRQCPHHHIPLFHCVLCPHSTASTGLTFFAPKTMSPTPYTTIPLRTAYCVHYVHWFDLFAPKTMSPPPYTTIPLRTASTAYCIHCVLRPLHALVGLCR